MPEQTKPKGFAPGTTPGEASWIISRALGALAPMAPAIFGKQNPVTQTVTLDMGAWMGAACALAVSIQEQAFAMTETETIKTEGE